VISIAGDERARKDLLSRKSDFCPVESGHEYDVNLSSIDSLRSILLAVTRRIKIMQLVVV